MKNTETRRMKIRQLRESKLANVTTKEVDALKKQIDSSDSIREITKLLRQYISLKVAYAESLVADDNNDDVDFEELSISLMEDLNRCYRLIAVITPSDYDTDK